MICALMSSDYRQMSGKESESESVSDANLLQQLKLTLTSPSLQQKLANIQISIRLKRKMYDFYSTQNILSLSTQHFVNLKDKNIFASTLCLLLRCSGHLICSFILKQMLQQNTFLKCFPYFLDINIHVLPQSGELIIHTEQNYLSTQASDDLDCVFDKKINSCFKVLVK